MEEEKKGKLGIPEGKDGDNHGGRESEASTTGREAYKASNQLFTHLRNIGFALVPNY